MSTVDINRVVRSLDHMAITAARPMRESEQKALSHALRTQVRLFTEIADAADEHPDRRLRYAGDVLSRSADTLFGAHAVVRAAKPESRWLRADLVNVPDAVELFRSAQTDAIFAAAMIGDTPLAVRAVPAQAPRNLDGLVPPELTRAADQQYPEHGSASGRATPAASMA